MQPFRVGAEWRESRPQRDERLLALARLEQLEVALLLDQEAGLLRSAIATTAHQLRVAEMVEQDRLGTDRRVAGAGDADRVEQGRCLIPAATSDGRPQVTDGRKLECVP
jgi:hypothetical protein